MGAYEQGRAFFERHKGDVNHFCYTEANPYWAGREENWREYDEFRRGVEDAREDYINNTLGVAAFEKELDDLCKKYNIQMYAGDCGGGRVMDSYGHWFDIVFQAGY